MKNEIHDIKEKQPRHI